MCQITKLDVHEQHDINRWTLTVNNYRHATVTTNDLDRNVCQIFRNRLFHVLGIFDEREGGRTQDCVGKLTRTRDNQRRVRRC